jgi:type II secretory pathway pseudopilin PulG
MRRRRGYFMAEATAGIAIIMALSVALLVSIFSQRRALRRLVEDRQAARLAEHALTQMQIGEYKSDAEIQVLPIDKVEAPVGHRWVDVKVKYNTGSASLSGLVPASVVSEKGSPQ